MRSSLRFRASTTVAAVGIVLIAALAACQPKEPAAEPPAAPVAEEQQPEPELPPAEDGVAKPPVAPPPAADPPPVHAGHGTGVAFDTAGIPRGDKGTGADEISHTGENPKRDPNDPSVGAFRNVCQYSHMNTDDPIVAPGKPGASHLHMFWGNTNVNASSTAESIAGSGNATCRGGTINRSAYWVPALIDGNGKPMAPKEIHVYYKSGYGGLRPGQIKQFPEGLRMIAGDSKADSPQSTRHFSWSCDEGAHKSAGIPVGCGGDTVMMEVIFPQCWDGKNADSPDHKSHMAYPSGGCPSSHPVPIPELTYRVYYRNTGNLSGWKLASDVYAMNGAQRNGKQAGYSIHGDWFDGWDHDVVKQWLANCVNQPVSCGSHMLGDGDVMG